MSCSSPRCALVPRGGGKPKFLSTDWPVGKHPLGRIVYLPCGGCLACRRERRQDLTVLQCCEASLHDENWFITLTYDDKKYQSLLGEPVFSLQKKHIQSFIESMRKWAKYNKTKFRFYGCGEYGERYFRPHYHLSVFGLSSDLLGLTDSSLDIRDRKKSLFNHGKFLCFKPPSVDSNGNPFWQSPVIADRWNFGNHQIYRASRETFQYVAGYVTKKLTGEQGREFRSTGRISEFSFQSRPSIGFPFFQKFRDKLSLPDGKRLVNDCIEISDISWRIPRIFDRWRENNDGFYELAEIKRFRSLNSPLIPDRDDLKRKAEFDRYSAKRYQEVNRSHMEIH